MPDDPELTGPAAFRRDLPRALWMAAAFAASTLFIRCMRHGLTLDALLLSLVSAATTTTAVLSVERWRRRRPRA